MTSVTPRVLRVVLALAGALVALTVIPAASHADNVIFGSDLSATANITEARQADTAYWQTTFADGHSPLAPASGQITSIRVRGIALSNPLAGVPGGETMIHFQTLHKQPDGSFKILVTTGAFFMPERGANPQTITTFSPENFCVAAGDVVVFNTVGGFDPTGRLYQMGTPLQIFSRVPGALVSEFMGADKTNNGDIITANNGPGAGHELLMQMTVGTGPDGTALCAGGTVGAAPSGTGGGGATPAPPTAPVVQKATIPAKQKVTVSTKGKLSVSVFCLPGTSRCQGTLRVMSRGRKPKSLGRASFNVAAKTTGHATVRLNALGKRRFAAAHGRLGVTLVAVTKPGDATRTSSLSVTLRRRR